MGVDELDFRILTHLLEHPFDGLEEVGRAVGLSGTAVRGHLDRLEAGGVFEGLVGLPDARVFGRHAVGHVFEDVELGVHALDALLDVDDVVWLMLGQQGAPFVLRYTRREDRAPPRALADAVGAEPSWTSTVHLPPFHGPEEPELSPIAWRVLEVLVADPRASIATLSERTGLWPKTVRKHRAKLRSSGALHVAPLLQEAHAVGHFLYHVHGVVDAPEHRSRLQAAFPGSVPFALHEAPPGLSLFAQAPSMGGALEAVEALEDLDDIQRTIFSVPRDNRCATERLQAWVRERIEAWNEARFDR